MFLPKVWMLVFSLTHRDCLPTLFVTTGESLPVLLAPFPCPATLLTSIMGQLQVSLRLAISSRSISMNGSSAYLSECVLCTQLGFRVRSDSTVSQVSWVGAKEEHEESEEVSGHFAYAVRERSWSSFNCRHYARHLRYLRQCSPRRCLKSGSNTLFFFSQVEIYLFHKDRYKLATSTMTVLEPTTTSHRRMSLLTAIECLVQFPVSRQLFNEDMGKHDPRVNPHCWPILAQGSMQRVTVTLCTQFR